MLKYRGSLTFQNLIRKKERVDESKGVQKQEDKQSNPRLKGFTEWDLKYSRHTVITTDNVFRVTKRSPRFVFEDFVVSRSL